MKIIESHKEWKSFMKEFKISNSVVLPIQCDPNVHPIKTELCLLYVRLLDGDTKEYVLPFRHSDAINLEHKYIEESGTMNIVFQIGDKLITPDENHDTILRGITKRSVIEVAEMWGVEVEERMITIKEVIEAAKNGTLKDAFGAGTAATIAPIAMIGYEDEKFMLPPVKDRLISNKIKKFLGDLKTGRVEDTFGWNFIV